jgi:hypothetical protein
MKVGEVDRVQSEFQKFKIKSNNSTDYLSNLICRSYVSIISLESTLSGRKYKEEEEERAEQRRVAAIASAPAEERRRR